MGRYVVAADLAVPVGWQELAQAVAPDERLIDGAALQADPLSDAAAAALGRLEAVIDSAESIVDSYILTVVPTYSEPDRTAGESPLSAVGVAALDIALERLLGPGADGERAKRAEERLDWLKRVAAGEIDLTVDAGGDGVADQQPAGISIDAPARTFSRTSLAGYVGR